MSNIKRLIINVVTALTLMFIPAVLPSVAYAATPAPASSCPTGQSAKAQVLQGLGATGSDCSDKPVNSLFATAVNILSIIIGVTSIIVVMISAFKYMTSGGEQNKVANAKGTLLYALVGVAVAGLAQLMVHFVLYQSTNLGH